MRPFYLRFARRAALSTSACLVAVLVLARPTSAAAQTISPADLVGSWARQGEKEVRATFRADSTITVAVGSNAGPGTANGHWHLVGDTLVLSDLMAKVGNQQQPVKLDRRVVALQDKQLTMTRVDNTEQGPKSRVYERVDSVQASPSKP